MFPLHQNSVSWAEPRQARVGSKSTMMESGELCAMTILMQMEGRLCADSWDCLSNILWQHGTLGQAQGRYG